MVSEKYVNSVHYDILPANFRASLQCQINKIGSGIAVIYHERLRVQCVYCEQYALCKSLSVTIDSKACKI